MNKGSLWPCTWRPCNITRTQGITGQKAIIFTTLFNDDNDDGGGVDDSSSSSNTISLVDCDSQLTSQRKCVCSNKNIPYFPAHKTHRDFFVRNFRKNNDECILILVIYWKKTGLLHNKISNHDIIYSSQKPRKSSSLPLKSSSLVVFTISR